MSQKTSIIDRRVVLQLNADMVFEALILNRLARLPKARHHEWLRGLLVQGFKRECRSLRTLQRGLDKSDKVPPRSKDRVAPESATSSEPAAAREGTTASAAESESLKQRTHRSDVSFAALRNVIG